MNPAIYAYIFYGSLVVMPMLLLLIFLMLDRCRVWSKKTAKGVAEVKSEVQQTVKQCLEKNYEKSIRDFELLETANESNAQSEKQAAIQFSPDDFFIPPSNSERELLEIQEIEAAFEEAFKEDSIEDKVRDLSSEHVADYSDKYLKRPTSASIISASSASRFPLNCGKLFTLWRMPMPAAAKTLSLFQ